MFESEIYINDLIEAVERIEKSTKSISFNFFKKNLDLQDATGMRCQVIGESVKKLPKKILKNYPEIKWKYLREIRNIISHEYFSFDVEIIWDFAKNEIPKIKKIIKKIKKDLK